MTDDYRRWLTCDQIPAGWLEAVKRSLHAAGPDAMCSCESGDEHVFMMDSVSDLAVWAMEALAPLVAAAEEKRHAAEIAARLRAAESWDDVHSLVASLAAGASPPAPLSADPAITCQQDIADPADGETVIGSCPELSRFVVERSDGDQSFGWAGKHEACEAHLADVAASMINGDEQVQAVVTIRWGATPAAPADANGYGWSYDEASGRHSDTVKQQED